MQSSMERWQNRVAVVTGASSGIGAAISLELIKAGMIVVGLARRVELIREQQQRLPVRQRDKLLPVQCDVSDESSVNKAFDWIEHKLGAIDVLVNNAGTIITGLLIDMPSKELQQVLHTNVMGIIYGTRRAYNSMKQREFAGHIVLINSILGHKLMGARDDCAPDINLYAPSKYAVTALTEMYRQEFLGLGTRIKVSSISPGVVDTEIVPDSVRGIVKDRILQPQDIAQAVLFVIATPPHVQVHEMIIKPIGELM